MYSIYRERCIEDRKLKLTYFNARGRCEAIRLLFAAGGLEYIDHRLEGHTEWSNLKPKTPSGTLPILEQDGNMIDQSKAIGRLVANMCGLSGENYVEQGLVDALVDVCVDIREDLMAAMMAYIQKQDDQEKIKTNTIEKIQPMLENLEKHLGDNRFFVGNKLSCADIQFYASMEIAVLTLRQADVMNLFPKLQALYERVATVPEIQAYLTSRPITEF